MNHESVEMRPTAPGDTTAGLTLEEAGIEICEETGLPLFITSPGSPVLTSEHVKMIEDDW